MRILFLFIVACATTACVNTNTKTHNTKPSDTTIPTIINNNVLLADTDSTTVISDSDNPDGLTTQKLKFKSDSMIAPHGMFSITLDLPICDDTIKWYVLEYMRDSLIRMASKTLLSDIPNLNNMPDIHKVGIEGFMQLAANNLGKSYHDNNIAYDYPHEVISGYIDFELQADTKAFISYSVTRGEHIAYWPGSFTIYTTIRKDNGKAVNNILRRDKAADIQSLLLQYIDENETDEYKQKFISMLQLFETDTIDKPFIPLPKNEPWLASDGVHIYYGANQVPKNFYVPTFVIPADKAKPFISEEAYYLLKQSEED